MPIFDLFSKRQKRLKGDIPEIYSFDTLPDQIRVQIVHIIRDTIGIDEYGSDSATEGYSFIHKSLCREYGVFFLLNNNYSAGDDLLNFFLKTQELHKAFDIIEFAFKYFDKVIRNDNNYRYNVKVKLGPDEAIEELNERFKENGIGYQYENGELIRLDSTFIHSEIVRPTISLLWNRKFSGANDEYMTAHEHYKKGRNKECLNFCLKALESTLKIICKEKGWSYSPTDQAKKLIQIVFENELVPTYVQNQFTSLRNIIESGVPPIRNKMGSHGQGQEIVTVDDNLTRYALNLTGANIIFLIEQSSIK